MPKPFQGFRTFCKTSDDNNLPYAVIGLPSDTATTFRPGARLGPSAIREASMMLSESIHSKFIVDIKNFVTDVGDVEIPTGHLEKTLEEIEKTTSNVLVWKKHPVFLGGDHLVTLGVLRALNKKFGRIALVNFDAHGDNSVGDFDDLVEHGSWLFRAVAENLIDASKVFTIGIRHPADVTGKSHLLSYGGTVFTARYAVNDMAAVITNIKSVIKDTPVFLSFDIDALDPAFAPGTGKPECGGLSTMWALSCIEELWDLNWIGMDMVEVCPPYDPSGITSLAAATIIWQYLSMVICKNQIMAANEQDKHIKY